MNKVTWTGRITLGVALHDALFINVRGNHARPGLPSLTHFHRRRTLTWQTLSSQIYTYDIYGI